MWIENFSILNLIVACVAENMDALNITSSINYEIQVLLNPCFILMVIFCIMVCDGSHNKYKCFSLFYKREN